MYQIFDVDYTAKFVECPLIYDCKDPVFGLS